MKQVIVIIVVALAMLACVSGNDVGETINIYQRAVGATEIPFP